MTDVLHVYILRLRQFLFTSVINKYSILVCGTVFMMRDHIYESLCLCVQDQNVAVRREGMGLVLDSKLPHLIGIDDDILSTGIMLYHLKVGHANILDCINFIVPLQQSIRIFIEKVHENIQYLNGKLILIQYFIFESSVSTCTGIWNFGGLWSKSLYECFIQTVKWFLV